MKNEQGRVSEIALAWAWAQVKDREYPAAVGVVLVYLATKARQDGPGGEWVASASHGELAGISGSQIRTVRGVMARLYGDGLVRVTSRSVSESRSQRAYAVAVDEKGR